MIVHHYTSLAIALQILEKREIWLSAVTSASDLGEYSYAADYLKGRISDWLTDELAQQHFCERMNNFVSLYGADLHEPDLAFYASFSALDDNATQWLAYGDGGNGMSIAFEIDGLRQQGDYASSSEVQYGKEGLKKIAERLGALKSWFDDHKLEVEDSSELGLAGLLADRAAVSCAYVKSEGFRMESEIRICIAPGVEIEGDAPSWKIKYRAFQNRIIPYVVLPFENGVVDSVRLGPFASHDTNRHAAASMLTDWVYSDTVRVHSSELKLR